MDEDDESQEVPYMFFAHMPPEVQEEYERQVDQMQMKAEVRANELKNFLASMDPENLAVFRSIMHAIVLHDQPDSVAAYYEGQAAAILTFVHNRCSHCGEEHDAVEEILEAPIPEDDDDVN